MIVYQYEARTNFGFYFGLLGIGMVRDSRRFGRPSPPPVSAHPPNLTLFSSMKGTSQVLKLCLLAQLKR